MKKIIYSILTLSLILTGSLSVTSCSSDDGAPKENPDPQDNEPQTQTLVVTASATSGYLGDVITLSATLDGAAVTSGVTYYVDDVAISGNTFTSDVEADLLVSAKYQNVTSDYVTVTFEVNPILAIEGSGSLVYNGGSSNELNKAYLRLRGFYWADETETSVIALWWQVAWNGNSIENASNLVAVAFSSPATANASGQIQTLVFPDENQNTYQSILGIRVNGQDKTPDEGYSGGNGVINFTALDLDSTPNTLNSTIQVTGGEHNIQFNYSGDILFLEGRPTKTEIKSFNQLKVDLKKLSESY